MALLRQVVNILKRTGSGKSLIGAFWKKVSTSIITYHDHMQQYSCQSLHKNVCLV